MRKVSKRIVKNISVVAILIFVMGLCSCKITNFNFKQTKRTAYYRKSCLDRK